MFAHRLDCVLVTNLTMFYIQVINLFCILVTDLSKFINKKVKSGIGAMSLFVGLNGTQEELQLKQHNIWAFTGYVQHNIWAFTGYVQHNIWAFPGYVRHNIWAFTGCVHSQQLA